MLARVKTGVAAHEAGTHVACDAQSKRALVAGSYGLAAFDIRDVTAPRKMAFVKTGVATFKGGAYVLIKGATAFVVGGYGLAVIDLGGLNAEPSSMEKIGGCNTGVCTYHGDEACQLRTRPSGDLLFIAGGGGFAVIDVSNPREPVKVKQIDTGVASNIGGAHCLLHTEKPIVYFAGGYGLAVIDVTDPTAPVKVGSSIKTGAASLQGNEGMEISPDGRSLFIAGGDGLAIFDIATDPLKPVRASWLSTGVATKEGGAHLAIVSSTLILVAGGMGLAAIDVSNLTEPKKVGMTSSKVATHKGGAHVAVYGERNEYAMVVGGMGMSVLTTDFAQWKPGGGACSVM